MDQAPPSERIKLTFALLKAHLEAAHVRLQGERQHYQSLSRRVEKVAAAMGVEFSDLALSSQPSSQRDLEGVAAAPAEAAVANELFAVAGTNAMDRLRQELRSACQRLGIADGANPVVSIITPTFNTSPQWLTEAALSVLGQSLGSWEWCIVDDGSEDTSFLELLPEFENVANVKIHLTGEHGGISRSLNRGLTMARGRYVCVLDHDDVLAPDALKHCVQALADGLDAVYTDEDKISEGGVRCEPFHKPDWSPEYFRGVMYIGHLLCFRRDLALSIGGFNSKYDRLQDFEFMLRYSEQTDRIGHVPEILYHWRKAPGSIAANQHAKGDLAHLHAQAVQAHLEPHLSKLDEGAEGRYWEWIP